MVVYTTLMNVLTRGGQKEQAMRIFRTMESDGMELDVVHIQSLEAFAVLLTLQIYNMLNKHSQCMSLATLL